MDPALRIVTHTPLTELWNSVGPLSAAKVRALDREDIAGLLRSAGVNFVVADCGHPLRWIPPTECYQFWKEEAKPRLAEPGKRFRLEDFPELYGYLASEWQTDSGEVAVLLEKHH